MEAAVSVHALYVHTMEKCLLVCFLRSRPAGKWCHPFFLQKRLKSKRRQTLRAAFCLSESCWSCRWKDFLCADWCNSAATPPTVTWRDDNSSLESPLLLLLPFFSPHFSSLFYPLHTWEAKLGCGVLAELLWAQHLLDYFFLTQTVKMIDAGRRHTPCSPSLSGYRLIGRDSGWD